MKFLIQLIVIFILAFVLELLLPWWSIAVAAAAGGYFFKTNGNFFAGFLAIAFLWVGKAYVIDASSAVSLVEMVSEILLINSKPLLFLITALIGGMVGGFAAVTGSGLKKTKKSRYY